MEAIVAQPEVSLAVQRRGRFLRRKAGPSPAPSGRPHKERQLGGPSAAGDDQIALVGRPAANQVDVTCFPKPHGPS